ncbi:MFS transporter [Paraburkholderia oxyphila]|uniref:MFS transporter n=1 Tax=Paraburkholderia oxyphila TaxID=614212 RepID=UPI000487C7D4|nr:MFS transporter [Paraburkholderia oxyphila]
MTNTNQIAVPEQSAQSSGGNDVGGHDRPTSLAAMISMTNLGAMTMLLTPALVAGYISSGSIDQAQASSLTATELTGMSAAVILTSILISRIDRRRFLAFGLMIAALGHLSSALVPTYHLLIASRAVAGFGIGITYAIAVAAVSRTRTPDRNFGLAITTNQLTVTLILWILSWLSVSKGYSGTMYVLLAVTLLTACTIGWFPREASQSNSPGITSRAKRSTSGVAGMLGLIGMFLFLIGIGGVWPFVAEIALAHGIPSDAVAYALTMAGFGGIVGGLLVSLIGLRFGRTLPIILGTLAMATTMLALRVVSDRVDLAICASLIMMFWIFSIPYYLGVLSSADSEGRFAMLSSAAMPFGLAAGQAIASGLDADKNFSMQVLVSSLVLLVALGMALASARMTGKIAAQ